MSMTIKVKRGSGTPSSLEYGELAANTNGDLFVGDSGGSPVQVNGGGGGGGGSTTALQSYSLIEEKVLGSDTTSFDFAATLDGDNDSSYYVEGFVFNKATHTIEMRLNGSVVAGSYQNVTMNGSTNSASRVTSGHRAAYGYINSLTTFTMLMPFSATTSLVSYRQTTNRSSIGNGTTAPLMMFQNNHLTTPAATTNITSLGFQSSTGSTNFGSGSIFRLYKLQNSADSATATISATSPNTTTTVDSVQISSIHTAKWIVKIEDATAGTYKSFEVFAADNGTATPDYGTSWQLGTFSDYSYEVLTTGSPLSTMELQVTNTGSNSITVKTKRIDVAA